MDTLAYLRFPLALVFVLALILLAALALRRFGWPSLAPVRAGRRLQLVESLPLDPKRRLVLLRRDQVEHLVLLAPEGGTVIERAIPTAPPVASPLVRDTPP